jgi:ABC-type sugar transport system ATPase subunit
MVDLLRVEALVTQASRARPLSFVLGRGEIVGVPLPKGAPREPLLPILCGAERPRTGVVRFGTARSSGLFAWRRETCVR